MERVIIFTISDDSSEIRALLDTLEVSVLKEFLQKRDTPHKIGFLGPGRLEEIEKELEDLEFDAIVINGTLKPSQHHYLEMRFQKECIDRTGIILRIFADHAHTPEAIAQVTLAKLRYELPFLREWIHKAKKGDRPGFLAGGAYATDVYFEHAKTHARRIEQNLKELSRQREITRAKRHARGYSLVSLAGYTNAGKSALFNRICGAEVEVDNRLFSTLSTTTRKVRGVSGNILMVDTVGFIQDLPANLIDAFNSTLEEIFYADLILLIFDCSDEIDVVKKKLLTSMSILLPRIEQQVLIVVGNKIDLIDNERKSRVISEVSDLVKPHELILVSARSGDGIEQLIEKIGTVQKRSCVIDASMPIADSTYSLLSRLRLSCNIIEHTRDGHVSVSLRCKPEESQKIIGWLAKAGGSRISTRSDDEQTESPSEGESSSGKEGAPLG